mgnify:CR=1 FL=1
MDCEKHWELRYGWHYVNDSSYVYNEYKVFCKEIDINRFVFELFHNKNIKNFCSPCRNPIFTIQKLLLYLDF